MPTLTPPVTIPVGQSIFWSTPTTTTNAGNFFNASCFGGPPYNGLSSSNTSGCALSLTGSCTLGLQDVWAQWGNFLPIPAFFKNYSIMGIYPVVLANGILGPNNTAQQYCVGPTVNMSNPVNPSPGYQINSLATSVGSYSSQVNWQSGGTVTSIGSTASDIANAKMGVGLFNSLIGSNYVDVANISYVALAVYITTPQIDIPSVSVSVGNTRKL